MQLQVLLSVTWLCHLAAGRSAVWYTDPVSHVLYRASTPSGLYFPYTASRETRDDTKQTSELLGNRASVAQRIDGGETQTQRQGNRITQRVDEAPQWTPLTSRFDGNSPLWNQIAARADGNSPQRSQPASRPVGYLPPRSQPVSRPDENSQLWSQIASKADGNSLRRSQNASRADGNSPQRSQSQRSGTSSNELQRRKPAQKNTQQTQTQQVAPQRVATKTQQITTQAPPRVAPSTAITEEVPFDDYWLEDDLKDQQEMASAQQGNNLLTATEKPEKQNVGNGPSRCVWAIVTCCKPQLADKPDIRYSCFEAAGCDGGFWDSHPCSKHMMQAALQATTNFYKSLPK